MTAAERAQLFAFNEVNHEGRKIKWINQLNQDLENRINHQQQPVDFMDGISITNDDVILTAARVAQSYCICLHAYTATNQLILRGIGQSCFLDPVHLLQEMCEEMQQQDQRIHRYAVYILGGVIGLTDDASQTLWENKDALTIQECILNLNAMITEEDSNNFDVIFTDEEIFFALI